MEIRFEPTTLPDLAPAIRAHLGGLPGYIEAFMEDHIDSAQLYRIIIEGSPAGYAAIYEEKLITQFALDEPFRPHGGAAFAALKRMEQVTSAFVPTCDPFYLAHALDEHRQLLRQACFWDSTEATLRLEAPAGYTLTPATAADIPTIREHTADFFDPLEQRVAHGEIFLNHRGAELVGYGIREKSRFYDRVATIGMFTLPDHRNTGVGTATIRQLIALNNSEGIRSVAGCWYYNHRSRRTLTKGGLYSPVRLLRIEF